MESVGPIVLIIGTRPEGIKMIPVYLALKKAGYPALICATMQHDELLSNVFNLFGIIPDYNLDIMRIRQDLFYLTQSVLQKTKELFLTIQPALVLVQGDTTSTLAAALSAFYLKIPVCHIEAGLRTDDLFAPFPEEMNRRVVSMIAQFHCAPTDSAVQNLIRQGIDKNKIFCTGNTVVDALRIIKQKIQTTKLVICKDIKKQVERCKKEQKKIMLLTVHRRESFAGGIKRILNTVKSFLETNSNVFCFYPYHPNPQVLNAIEAVGLTSLPNILLSEPLSYKELVYLLLASDLVLTDSGGIQEEAVSLAKPILVLREKTERVEGINAGSAQLVGTDPEKIVIGLNKIFKQKKSDNDISSIYGDGYAAQKIVTVIQNEWLKNIKIPEKEVEKSIQVKPAKRDTSMKKVCVVGLGYIGLPTAIVMADAGLKVIGYDIDSKRVASINKGDPVIQEPDIYEKLQLVLQSGKFWATTTLSPADYFMLAVPTPILKNKKADLSYVFDAAKKICSVLKKGNTIILESTIPVGATEKFAEFLQKETGFNVGTDLFVAHCPERVLPGKIFKELVENDRIIGGIDRQSAQKAKEIYEHFVCGTLYLTNAACAEMVKLVENSSRDAQIAFAHQVASMSYKVGLNPYEVIELANKHPRVNILRPTCGVGGHCIAIDPWFLIESFPDHSSFIQAAREVNDKKPHEVLQFIKKGVEQWQQKNSGTCIVLTLGLTYKSNVDDLRESPALYITQRLAEWNDIMLLTCEPHINNQKLKSIVGERVVTLTDGLSQADIVVFLVGHKRFKAIDKKLLQHKTVFDFAGVFHTKKEENENNEYFFWPEEPYDNPTLANSVRKKKESELGG